MNSHQISAEPCVTIDRKLCAFSKEFLVDLIALFMGLENTASLVQKCRRYMKKLVEQYDKEILDEESLIEE